MAPCTPKSYTAGSNPVLKFDGAFHVTKCPPPPGRSIHFHVRIQAHHPLLKSLERQGKKPPTHFHPRQWEYFNIIRGSLTVEINGVPNEFTSSSGEFALKPGPHHRLYATPGQIDDECEFYLGASAPEDPRQAQIDQAFFENWYGYQEDIMLRGVRPDPIQVLSMFDAGDSYLSVPAWMPARHILGLLLGIVVGRWIGGLLGYAPFHPEWTTDWEGACRKMEGCWAQRRFADRGAQERVRRRYLNEGKEVGNEGLYAKDESGELKLKN